MMGTPSSFEYAKAFAAACHDERREPILRDRRVHKTGDAPVNLLTQLLLYDDRRPPPTPSDLHTLLRTYLQTMQTFATNHRAKPPTVCHQWHAAQPGALPRGSIANSFVVSSAYSVTLRNVNVNGNDTNNTVENYKKLLDTGDYIDDFYVSDKMYERRSVRTSSNPSRFKNRRDWKTRTTFFTQYIRGLGLYDKYHDRSRGDFILDNDVAESPRRVPEEEGLWEYLDLMGYAMVLLDMLWIVLHKGWIVDIRSVELWRGVPEFILHLLCDLNVTTFGYVLDTYDLDTLEKRSDMHTGMHQWLRCIGDACRAFGRPKPASGGSGSGSGSGTKKDKKTKTAAKVHVLGRERCVRVVGRAQFVTYRKQLIKLSDARKLEARKLEALYKKNDKRKQKTKA